MQTTIPLTTEARDILGKLEELWNFANSATQGHTIQWQSDLRRVILMSMTGAFHRTIRAILSEIRGGSVDGLDSHVRSLVEGLINTKYIIEDNTQMRARAYIAHDHRDRIAELRRLIPLLERNAAPGMATATDAERYRNLLAQLEQELNQTEAQYGRDSIRWPSLEERARTSNTEELYATAFWLLSLDAHMTARGLDRFMREGENNNLIIELGQDLSRVYMHLRTAYISYLALLNESSNMLKVPSRQELDRFELS